MKNKHGMVFLVIGITVFVVSWFVDKKRLKFFIYLSFIFITVGIIKMLLVKKMLQKKEHNKKLPQNVEHVKQFQKLANKPIQHVSKPIIRRCLRCHHAMLPSDKFCSKCGARTIR